MQAIDQCLLPLDPPQGQVPVAGGSGEPNPPIHDH
jgi:hypothetical protein